MRLATQAIATGAPNKSFKRRPLRVHEIGAFLKGRIGLNVVAIYRWRPRLTSPLGRATIALRLLSDDRPDILYLCAAFSFSRRSTRL